MRVGRRYKFRGVHSLSDLPPPWCDEHEHVYTIEVEGEGESPYAVDMEAWDGVFLPYLDENLNDHFSPSTVEVIASDLLKSGAFPGATAITVWEDDNRWARAE